MGFGLALLRYAVFPPFYGDTLCPMTYDSRYITYTSEVGLRDNLLSYAPESNDRKPVYSCTEL